MFYLENKERIYLVDSDVEMKQKLWADNAYVITYGFSPKATISVSSVDSEQLVMCLQRRIKTIYGEEIEPQEFAVMLSKDIDVKAVMLAVVTAAVCGVVPDIIKRLVF